MTRMDLSRAESVAFYDKSEAQEYIMAVMDKEGVVGVDVGIEETEMEDRRTTATLTVYTITTFYDLTQIKIMQ